MRLHLAVGLAAFLFIAACNGSSTGPSPASSPTDAPTPTTSPTLILTPSPTAHGSSEVSPLQFDATRAFVHVEALAVDIGSRLSGSEAEREAARYLRDQLQEFGYETTLQPFTEDVFADAGSSLKVLSPQTLSPAVFPFDPSANGTAQATLVEAGIGRPADFPEDIAGKIALIERGILYYEDKVANAADAGAVAAVIYNNEPGLFGGDLTEPSTIPALAVSQADGEKLLSMVEAGPVEVRLEVQTDTGARQSQNVIARPPDGECRVVAGGHYDSIAAGPGANDNASGTATAVEIARVLAADGEFDDVCFVLFGAEESGLIGSTHFVQSLTTSERETLEAMINFDMVGSGTQWLLIGSSSLTDIAAEEAEERGLDYEVDNSLASVGSDQASFISAGFPAIFFHSFSTFIADDPNYHTARDEARHVEPRRMAEVAGVALAMIDVLLVSR